MICEVKIMRGDKKLKEEDLRKAEEYYDLNKSNAQECAERIKQILQGCLFGKNLHSIESRVKDKDSYLDKCNKQNKYTTHEEITDLIGIRVIANTMSDVNEICKIIKDEFDIDGTKSMNKADELETDKVGYLSVHYIAKLTEARSKQTEHSRIKDFSFEIQVRTLLQHAWSEIEHDISYKNSKGSVNNVIQRRFNLIAGTLELLDIEFDRLAKKAQVHFEKVEEQVQKGEYDIDIDIASLEEYMKQKFGERKSYIDDSTLELLNYMGLYKISDIENIMPEEYNPSNNVYYGILVDILIIYNIEKFKPIRSSELFLEYEINLYRDYGIDVDKHFIYIDQGVYAFKN